MAFDPDAYLAAKAQQPAAATASGGFDPDAYLAGKTVPAPSSPSPLAVAASRAESIGHGIKDPVTGLAQLMAHVLPEKAVEAGNDLQNWMAKYGIMDKVPTKDAAGKPVKGAAAVDAAIAQDEANVASNKQYAGRDGADWFRLAGNVISPANLAVASRAPAAASLGGRVATGIGQGAATAAMQPVTSGNFAAEKAKQMGTGAALGGAIPAVAEGVSRVIKPLTSAAVKKLADAGVSMTPGQILGGWAGRVEEAMTSVPIIGDAIKGAQRRGIVSFNNAAVNDALKPIGEKLPKGVEGPDALAYARTKLGDAYDSLLPKLKGDLNTKLSGNITLADQLNNIKKLGQASAELSPQQKKILQATVENDIKSKFTKNGLASGDTVKDVQEVLRNKAQKYQISNDPGDRTLAGAFKEMESSVRKMVEEANPAYKGELSKINTGYASFKRAQRAGSTVGTKDGFFTPAQYNNAVKALDKTKDKRAFSEGTALGQELAQAGKSVLSQTVPDSGTALRSLMENAALGGGAFAAGGVPLAAGAMAAPAIYSAPGTSLMQKALMSRPQGAQPLSQLIRGSAPAITAGAVPLSQLMMSSQGE